MIMLPITTQSKRHVLAKLQERQRYAKNCLAASSDPNASPLHVSANEPLGKQRGNNPPQPHRQNKAHGVKGTVYWAAEEAKYTAKYKSKQAGTHDAVWTAAVPEYVK